MGGWNKGIKNSTGMGFKGKKHNQKSIEKLKNRPKECYKKPQAESIETTNKCAYGCGNIAKYKFSNGKLCCSTSHNSCPSKRKAFSNLDHTERAAKSLATRLQKGITKSCQIKATKTRKNNGHYKKLAVKMQEHWALNPWQNNLDCPILSYKNTHLRYQGSYEFEFLEELEEEFGIEWLIKNVNRGPSLWYTDPTDQSKRLYISDFIIDTTIYEIKSGWTWNKHGKDKKLEEKNKAKLTECIKQGYNVVLVLNQQRLKYEEIMD